MSKSVVSVPCVAADRKLAPPSKALPIQKCSGVQPTLLPSWAAAGNQTTTLLAAFQQQTAAERLLPGRSFNLENALSEAVRFFQMSALSSAVGLKVDFDMALLVIASGLYRLLARLTKKQLQALAR
ncbi:MAG: hypothetical protein HYZ20_07620 [Burkholderiales bacterium]|nr:hypothetical protein [Burkholderiales bacterium]